jgi:hypothetical protein
MASGLSDGVGLMWAAFCDQTINKINDHAKKTNGYAGQVVREMREFILANALSGRGLGALPELLETEILLASLCQFEGELGKIGNGETQDRQQESEGNVRAVRREAQKSEAPACPSPGFRHSQQRAKEPGDIVRELSHEAASLDRKIKEAVVHLMPLSARLPGDLGLIRGAGNAINPWIAAEFIKATIYN